MLDLENSSVSDEFSDCPIVLQACLWPFGSDLPCNFPALPSPPAVPIVVAVSHLCMHTSLCLEAISSFGARLVFQNLTSCSVTLSGKPSLPEQSLVRNPRPLPEHRSVCIVHGSDSELVVSLTMHQALYHTLHIQRPVR